MMLRFLRMEDESSVTPMVRFLWAVAGLTWCLGVFSEAKYDVAGAIAASGGLSIAFTAPFFGSVLAKVNSYSIWSAVKLFHAATEVKLGENLGIGPTWSGEKLEKGLSKAREQKNRLENARNSIDGSSRRLIQAQIWIVSIGSAIWALGEWMGNLFFHCGELSCP